MRVVRRFGLGRNDPGGGRHRQSPGRSAGFAAFLRVFVWGHVMGVAVYLVHGAFWVLTVAYTRLAGDRPTPLWETLRLSEGSVLGRWVLGVLTVCLLLAGYRRHLGPDGAPRGR